MNFGYLRVSTEEKDLNSQLDILKQASCYKIYIEKILGIKHDRPEFNNIIY